MSFNLHWHRRKKMEEALKENVRGALRVSIDPQALKGIYAVLKKATKPPVVTSRRDMARKCGLASTTIDRLINEPEKANCTMETVEAISEFVLPHLRRIWGYDAEQLADDFLGKDAPLRRDLIQALRGK